MKTISFFISSTFRDMDFERDCLNTIVAPKLQEYYLQYGYNVRFFDLRWGVIANDKEQEEEREKKILRTCFEAIDNCKPFFIALLGHRYGWIPEKQTYTLLDNLHSKFFEYIGIDNPSVTAMEIAYGIFAKQNFERSLVFIRKQSSYENIRDLDPYIEHDSKLINCAEILKEEIKKSFSKRKLDNHVIQYYVNLSEPSESRFKVCTLFEKEIQKCVDNYIKIDRNSKLNEYDILSERALFHYVCPQSYTGIVEKVLKGESTIIYGDEGFGKTSLSFFISNELKKKGNVVLHHTVGYSDISYDPHEMIWKWNRQFEADKVFGGNKINKLDSIEKEWNRLHFLNRIIPKRFTIIIDSIDRMNDDFSKSNLMIVLPSDIQFIILSKEKLPNWEYALKTASFKLKGISKSEALELIIETCGFYGKKLSPVVADKILLKRCSKYCSYSPLELLTILDFLLRMDAEDYKKIRSSSGSSEEDKINNYMISFIEDVSPGINGMYNRIFHEIEEIYGLKAIIPLKVLSLSRGGFDENELHQILKQNFDLLQFTIVRQLLHQSLTDNFVSKKWYFKQDTVRRTLVDYTSPSLPSNEYFLKIMSEAPYLEEERIYYAVIIQNHNALMRYITAYDNDTITRELIRAIYETSLIHILDCLKKCLSKDENIVDKVFRLLIFNLYLQSFGEDEQDRIFYWNSILEELGNEYLLKRERVIFLKARCNEILGDAYMACNDKEKAQNYYRQAACYYHILNMKAEKEKCRMQLLNVIN
jgi:hypothetical protein